MSNTIMIDRAGRVVIPKPVRDSLGLEPGDSLELSTSDDGLTLRPVRQSAPLVKEMGIWVFRTGRPMLESAVDLIDQDREARMDELLP